MVQLDFKNDYICTYKNVLTEDQCQHLIDKFEDSQHQQSKTNLKNLRKPSNIKKEEINENRLTPNFGDQGPTTSPGTPHHATRA